MSVITIQCRLVASESTRQELWKLMAQMNTPLINELLEQVSRHPEFETWRQEGKLPTKVVSQLCQSLKTDPRFTGQPCRFYTSATSVVNYIYKSWLALQKRLQQKLDGKRRWLEMLKSDVELVEASGYTLDALRTKAAEILAQLSLPLEPGKGKQGKNRKAAAPNRSLSNLLFEAYGNTDDILHQCAICYLIKNGCKVNDTEEDPEKFALRRRKVQVAIERLSEQLASRIPLGRELTNTRWLETLDLATTTVPQDNYEAKRWQDALLTKSGYLPFPVLFETNEDLRWSKNQKGRLCVGFNGLTELTFEVYCDRRQLHWFERFLEDQETKRKSKDQHSCALFTLRSGRLGWQEGQGKGEPWQAHRLVLYCTVDTRLWTQEGTEQVRSQKAAKVANILTNMKGKDDITKNQQAFIKSKQSTLARINTPFNRPSQPLYQGQSHILVGVSLGLDKPATVAVVDAIAQTVLTYRSVRQLLGENYPLLNRQRLEQQDGAHQRHKAQKQSAPNDFGASELGEYIDRLLAKEIVAIATSFQAGSIVLPDLKDMREIIQSELETRAKQKHPDLVEVQKRYAKQYRIHIHQWSYNRLIDNIQAQAAKAGISIEVGKQTRLGTVSVQEKARDLAIFAYQSRLSKA